MREILLILHFIGLAMGLGTSFAMLTFNLAFKNDDPQERAAFMKKALVLSKMASIGLLILIISGVTLLVPAWAAHKVNAFLHIKLTLVVILIGVFGFMQMTIAKIKRATVESYVKRMQILGMVTFTTLILIVISAVLTFH